jgi:hypothetical protein
MSALLRLDCALLVALKDSRGACDNETSQARVVEDNEQFIDYLSADVRWCTKCAVISDSAVTLSSLTNVPTRCF